MSNANESKDLKIEDMKIENLEKPLTEQEMKETTGGGSTPKPNPLYGTGRGNRGAN